MFLGPQEQALLGPQEQVFRGPQKPVLPEPLEPVLPEPQKPVLPEPQKPVLPEPLEPQKPLEPLEPDLRSPSSGSECEVRHDGWQPCPLACHSRRQENPHRSRLPRAFLRPPPCRSSR